MCPAPSSRTEFGPADRVDNDDVARYDRLGDAWWDPKGAMAPLHKLNPTRIRYLRDLMIRHFAVAPSAVSAAGGPVRPRYRLRRRASCPSPWPGSGVA